MPSLSPEMPVIRHQCLFSRSAAAEVLLIGLVAALTAAGCQTGPLSGHAKLTMLPESQEIALGVQAYRQTQANEPVSENEQLVAMVNRVGRRIAEAADKPEYDWEFQVITKDDLKSFALPGGKVVVYEGIIPICQDEAGLAVVISHEIGHLLARHSGERMTKNAVRPSVDELLQAHGVVTKDGELAAYSRQHESEADAIGLILMAKAGYDPSAAPVFWARFARQSGDRPSELLALHPADARRAADLRSMLPDAMNYYKAASTQLGLGEALPRISRPPTSTIRPVDSPSDTPTALALAPGAPQKGLMGPPPARPKKVDQASETEDLVSNTQTHPRTDRFVLPAVTGQLSPLDADAHYPAEDWSHPVDDGWRRATGRAVVQ